MLNLNFDFNGKTFLRQWWPMVKSLFQQVQSAINGEETARTEADAREASYRQNADQTLLNEIVDETRARTTADHVITDKVGRKMEAYDFGDYNASTGDTQNTINAIAPDGTQIFPSRGAILKFTVTEQNTDRVELPIEGLGYTDPVKPVYVIDYDFVTGHTYLASVTQVMRVTGTVPGPHTVTQIANGAAKVIFDNGDITDGAVTTDKVVDSSVTTTKIADGAVTKVKLGADVPAVAKTGSFNDLTDVPPADADTLGLVELSDTLDNTHDVGGGKAATPKAVYIAYDRARQADNTATANRTAISIINGNDTVEGSTDKKIKDAINAFATQLTNDGTVNTYKEALDWIAAHGSDYTALLGQVNTNTSALANKANTSDVVNAIVTAKNYTDSAIATQSTNKTDLYGEPWGFWWVQFWGETPIPYAVVENGTIKVYVHIPSEILWYDDITDTRGTIYNKNSKNYVSAEIIEIPSELLNSVYIGVRYYKEYEKRTAGTVTTLKPYLEFFVTDTPITGGVNYNNKTMQISFLHYSDIIIPTFQEGETTKNTTYSGGYYNNSSGRYSASAQYPYGGGTKPVYYFGYNDGGTYRNLSYLKTNTKNSLLDAINELYDAVAAITNGTV